MKLLVILVVAFFDTTYASKCIGKCESWHEDDLFDDNWLDHLLEHEDCDKYCECTPWGEPIEYSCEDGKYFSSVWEECVDPSLVDCKNVALDTTLTPTSPSSTSPSTIPSTSSPTIEPSTTLPPATEPSTTVPSTTEPLTTEPSTTSTSTTLPPATEPSTTSTSTTEPSITTPPVDKNGCIGICPSRNPLDHVELLPNKNCTKFCMCDWGVAKPMNCPAGLLFNNKVKSCDWPYNVDCQSPNHIGKFKYLASQRTLSKSANYENEITEQVDDQEDQEVAGCLGNCPMTNSLDHTVHIPHKNCKNFVNVTGAKKLLSIAR